MSGEFILAMRDGESKQETQIRDLAQLATHIPSELLNLHLRFRSVSTGAMLCLIGRQQPLMVLGK